MSRMLCKCGAIMGTSISPSPYSLCIYTEQEVQAAIAENPKILLSDFLTDWDEIHGKQKNFMKRSERVDYWYCTECQRVYETQIQIGGHWLRMYQRMNHPSDISYKTWTRIYVFKEIETDAAIEGNPQLPLSAYLEMHGNIRYLLSPDQKAVVAISTEKQKILYTYIQEAINS